MIKKLIVYGCSISYGLNADKDKIYSQRIADELGLELINLSICGAGNIVNANKLINTDVEFFKDAAVIFQTTYFERQTLRKYLKNPYYGVSEIEKDCNSYDTETFDIDIAGLTINDWVGYWAPLPPNIWKYHKKFNYEKWINYLKSMFIQNAIFLYSAHTFLKQNNIPHIFFDIPVPVMSYKCEFKDWMHKQNTKDGFHGEGAKNYFSNTNNDSINSFYKYFINHNFELIDLISEKNKITDIVVEPIYNNHKAIWKEDKFLLPQNKHQFGKPDGSHPSEIGHELIYYCLKDKFKEKGFLYF